MPDSSIESSRSHSGQTNARPFLGSVDVNCTLLRVIRTTRTELIGSRQCGHLAGSSSVYSATSCQWPRICSASALTSSMSGITYASSAGSSAISPAYRIHPRTAILRPYENTHPLHGDGDADRRARVGPDARAGGRRVHRDDTLELE